MDVDDNVGGEQGALPFFKVTSCLPDVGCTTRTLPNTAQALATNHGQLAQEGNEPCRNESLNGTWFRGIGGHNWVYPSVSSMPPSVTDRHSSAKQKHAFIISCQNTGCTIRPYNHQRHHDEDAMHTTR